MTKTKLCGITNANDISVINELKPDFIGFVFAKGSKRYISPKEAAKLKAMIHKEIRTVGVFVDEPMENIVQLLQQGIIDLAQLHGREDESYIMKLKDLTDKSVIKAFRIKAQQDLEEVESCKADYVLLDSGAGSGETFDWDILRGIKRNYFLAGGLDSENVRLAIASLHPYAVDVSSGIETEGRKDAAKMKAFLSAVRE